MTSTYLSIVVPVFNEADNLRPLTDQIRKTLTQMPDCGEERWEVLLINDGSTDASATVMTAINQTDPRIQPIHFSANQGQTAAMDAGIRRARGAFLVTMDADLQNDPADIPALFAAMQPGIGAVCGIRVKRRDSWIKRISSRIANWVRNRLSGENITDTGCSLKLFRRTCFDNIKLFEGMHRFLPTLVKMEGYQVVEVPVNHRPRLAGESKYGVWNRLFKSFRDLLAVRWMKARQLHYDVVPHPVEQPHRSNPAPSLVEQPSHQTK